MFRTLLASSGLVLFALVGCEDHFLMGEPPGELQVVYVNGEPDHCIIAPRGQSRTAPSQALPPPSSSDPSIAQGR